MTPEEFKQRYPLMAQGMSEEQIQEICNRPAPDPEEYYFDWLMQEHAYFSWTFTRSDILERSVLMMAN